jgi:hypothetical protein
MVEYVELDGKRFPVKYGFWALKRFNDATNTTFVGIIDLMKVAKIGDILILAQIGLEEGARMFGEKFNHSQEEIAGWFDKNPMVFVEFVNVLAKSIGSQKIDSDTSGMIADQKKS